MAMPMTGAGSMTPIATSSKTPISSTPGRPCVCRSTSPGDRMRVQRVSLLALGCASLIIAAACGRKASGGENTSAGTSTIGGTSTISVTDINLGRAINPDLTIKDGTGTFRPSDVVYASVETKGAAAATLGVRWTYNDNQLV